MQKCFYLFCFVGVELRVYGKWKKKMFVDVLFQRKIKIWFRKNHIYTHTHTNNKTHDTKTKGNLIIVIILQSVSYYINWITFCCRTRRKKIPCYFSIHILWGGEGRERITYSPFTNINFLVGCCCLLACVFVLKNFFFF